MMPLSLVPPAQSTGFKVVGQARLLRDLNIAGYIDQCTVAVGMQVIARMASTSSCAVTITQTDISLTWVSYKGEILARPAMYSAPQFTRALQELQTIAGIRNALTPALMPANADEAHFTLDPRMPTPAYTPVTPIYFEGDQETQDRIRAFLDTEFAKAVLSTSTEMRIG